MVRASVRQESRRIEGTLNVHNGGVLALISANRAQSAEPVRIRRFRTGTGVVDSARMARYRAPNVLENRVVTPEGIRARPRRRRFGLDM
jgi:hypothetical protein